MRTYATGRTWTRDELIDLFREPYRGTTTENRITLSDVQSYLRNHDLDPVGHEYFPPTPVFTDDSVDLGERIRAVTSHEHARENTRPSRRLYSVDGYPVYAPSYLSEQ